MFNGVKVEEKAAESTFVHRPREDEIVRKKDKYWGKVTGMGVGLFF